MTRSSPGFRLPLTMRVNVKSVTPRAHLDGLESLVRKQLPHDAGVLAPAASAQRPVRRRPPPPPPPRATRAASALPPPHRRHCHRPPLPAAPAPAALAAPPAPVPAAPASLPPSALRRSSRAHPVMSYFAYSDDDLAVGQIRLEPQRAVGNFDDILGFGHGNRNVRGHPGKQPQIGIIERNHRVVGHHILNRGGIHAHLRNGSAERFPRKRIHAKRRLLRRP